MMSFSYGFNLYRLTAMLVFLIQAAGIYAAPVHAVDPISFTFKLNPVAEKSQSFYDVRVRLNMDKEWHVAHPDNPPRESIPPQIIWKNSHNIKNVQIIWPADKRALEDGSIVRLRVYPKRLDKPVGVVLNISFSVCGVQCRYFDEKIAAYLPTFVDYIAGDVDAVSHLPRSQSPERSLLFILLAAFLGGLILNFMPCVLPVLSLKLMSFTRGDLTLIQVRRKTLMTFLGIMSSFILLATVVVMLRGVGVLVGWGMHFQQPLFIAFMMGILALFGVNLLGFFEFYTPQIGTAAVKCPQESAWYDFWLGALATLLATPCSAPFLGTAVGYALTHDLFTVYSVFLMLGAGFGLPYIIIIFYPRLHCLLPRPGLWMERLRTVLGICLLATATWLGVILVQEVSTSPKSSQHALLIDKEKRVYKFTPTLLDALVNQGETVFVDITAKWCVTCLANKQLVLSRADLARKFKRQKIITLVGDWTTPSPQITKFINANGRYGIPYNGFYSKRCPKGELLPEVLTKEMIEERLAQCATR